jgi:hypothetical protein
MAERLFEPEWVPIETGGQPNQQYTHQLSCFNVRLHGPNTPLIALCRRMRGPATTAMILFQRFFMRQSFLRHDRSVRGTSLAFQRAVFVHLVVT